MWFIASVTPVAGSQLGPHMFSQGRDGHVKFWQLDASLGGIRQMEMQINTGAFSFCRCAVAPMQARTSPSSELFSCAVSLQILVYHVGAAKLQP